MSLYIQHGKDVVSDLLPSSLILPIVEYFKDIITLRICQHQPVHEILQHFVRYFWVSKAQSILHTYSKGSYGSPRIPGCYHWRNRQLETFRKSWDGWVSEWANRFLEICIVEIGVFYDSASQSAIMFFFCERRKSVAILDFLYHILISANKKSTDFIYVNAIIPGCGNLTFFLDALLGPVRTPFGLPCCL